MITLYLDTDCRHLRKGPTNRAKLESLEFKRADLEDITLYLMDGTSYVTGLSAVTMGFKLAGDYDGSFLTYSELLSSGNGFIGEIDFYTETIVEAFSADETVRIKAMGEIVYGEVSSLTFPVTIYRDVITGSEGQPSIADPAFPTGSELFQALTDIETLSADIIELEAGITGLELDIDALSAEIDSKADTGHLHEINDILTLQSTLTAIDSDIADIQYDINNHIHIIGDVTNLQTTLDGKASTSHTHILSDITDLQYTIGTGSNADSGKLSVYDEDGKLRAVGFKAVDGAFFASYNTGQIYIYDGSNSFGITFPTPTGSNGVTFKDQSGDVLLTTDCSDMYVSGKVMTWGSTLADTRSSLGLGTGDAPTFAALTVNGTTVFSGTSLTAANQTYAGNSSIITGGLGDTRYVRSTWGTLTSSTPATITQTWNSGGTVFTGFNMNITDTASSANSFLMDLQVGGVTKAWIRKSGSMAIVGDFNATGNIVASTSIYAVSNTSKLIFGTNQVTFLQRDDADHTIAQRNGTNANEFRVYGTYTSSTNFERLNLKSVASNNFVIGTEKGSGGGTARGIDVKTDNTTRMSISSTGLITTVPLASATPVNNGDLVVEATSNTTLTFKLKGTDGTVRTGTITLA